MSRSKIRNVATLLSAIEAGRLQGRVDFTANAPYTAWANFKAFQRLRERAKGKLTEERLKGWLRDAVNAADDLSLAGALAMPLAEFRRRLEATRTGKGRRCKAQRTGGELVLSALLLHHRYENGFIGEHEPASLGRLAELSGVSRQAASNFLAAKLGKPGHKLYKAKCANYTIGQLLALWSGELPKGLLDLLDEEYGRRRERP